MQLEFNDPQITDLMRSIRMSRLQPKCMHCDSILTFPAFEVHLIGGEVKCTCVGSCMSEKSVRKPMVLQHAS